MEGRENDDDDIPWVPRRGEHVPPPWFERDEESLHGDLDDAVLARSFSWLRTLGLLALVLLIIWVPVDFAINYYSYSSAAGRTDLTLGFVWAVVIEALAVWGLIRLLTRR